jgi:hypothetical protein
VGHVIGGEAVERPDDAQHRNIDIGENIDRRTKDHHRTGEHDQQRHHDEGVRSAQCKPDDPHGANLSLAVDAMNVAPL